MTRYIIRRLLQAIPTLIGISILSFILVNAAPGDPITMRTFGDPRMTEEAREILRRQLGLDQPAIVQYFAWMTGLSVRQGDQVAMMTTPDNTCGYVGGLDVTVCDGGGGILRGDLGTSIDTKQPVWERIVERMPATLELGITSLLLSLLDRRAAGRAECGLSRLALRQPGALLRRDFPRRPDLLDGADPDPGLLGGGWAGCPPAGGRR